MRGGPPPAVEFSPQQAFSAVTILHATFSVAILMYFVVGEIMAARVEDFRPGGFVDLEDGLIWAVRGLLAATGVAGLVLAFTMFGDDRNVPRMVDRVEPVTDSTVAGVIQTGHILRLAFTESIAIYGLVLFQMNGHRYDLYGFGGAALLVLFLSRPSRDHWEAIFREMSVRYPNVNSSPWSRPA